MSNLKSNNFDFLKVRLNKSQYWDFYICHDQYPFTGNTGDGELSTECLSSYIDLSNDDCISGDTWLLSDSTYSWEYAVSTGKTLNNISYTGLDNGLFTYRKDRISNKEFNELFQSNSFTLDEGDYRLKLHAVSGNTLVYDYPLHISNGEATLNGGFFQGFFKTTCDEYQVLPSALNNGDTWELEFELNPCEMEAESDKTLNDKYPNNKGIFFFIGTRAENKFIYWYDEDDKEGKEACVQLGLDDFVEGGEIDKKEYVIGNFYDVNPDWIDDPDPTKLSFNGSLDEYLNYNYYDDSLYEDILANDDYSDFIDLSPFTKKVTTIDETLDHISIDSCGSCEDKVEKYKLVPFYTSCGCPKKYKKIKEEVTFPDEEDFIFGGNYIDGLDEFCDYDMDYLEDEMDISDFDYKTDNGFSLGIAGYYYFYTDNKFMLFDRTCDGYNTKNWVEGIQMMYYGRKNKFKGNLFILMNRTCTGYTVNNIQPLIDEANQEYDVYKDIYRNALAFRITDDGEIGYRYLSRDCDISGDDQTTIIENYSFKDVIPQCEYSTVHIRISCVGDKMMFEFYVNGKLVYITDWMDKLLLRELDDLMEKQEGVPYNISLGGGSQGLSESIQSNYYLEASRLYPIEENFAGSFIGYMKSFKFYTCKQSYSQIVNNYKYELSRLSII